MYLFEPFLCNLTPEYIQNRSPQELAVYKNFINTLWNHCVEDWNKKDLLKFDALVGENACQIRAIKLTVMAKNSHVASKDCEFLFSCYILNKTRVVIDDEQLTLKEVSDPKRLHMIDPSIPMRFYRELENKAKRSLSIKSVEFVRECALESGDETLIRMSSPEYTFLHRGYLAAIPMFWSYKTLLWKAEKENIPLRFILKYQGSPLHHFGDISVKNAPCCVIEGSLNQMRTQISDYSPKEIILAGAADHRQYPNEEQDSVLPLHDEFIHFRKLAKKEGYSLCNPSKFFIKHVYANMY